MPAQTLNWIPNSFYRLRAPSLAGHVAEVGPGLLRGYVIRASGIRRVNGQFQYSQEDVVRPSEWDGAGNCLGERSYDLMELMRP